jgi:membrane protease YdiL (CAAX protease family)
MILTIFTVHFLGTCGMVFVQWATDHWLFSFENYYDPDTGMDWTQTADMILLAPLREELTFRGMVFTIFYLRGVAFKVAPTAPAVVEGDDSSSASFQAVAPSTNESLAWTSSWKLDCIIASSITFGAVHLLNLFGNRYTKTYIILQVFLGMTLGAFYCFRFVLSENAMLETVTLHMINNFFSSFLPIDQELDLTDPLISLPRESSEAHLNSMQSLSSACSLFVAFASLGLLQ